MRDLASKTVCKRCMLAKENRLCGSRSATHHCRSACHNSSTASPTAKSGAGCGCRRGRGCTTPRVGPSHITAALARGHILAASLTAEGRGARVGCASMKPGAGKCHDSRPAGKLPLVRVSLARARCVMILPIVRRRAARSELVFSVENLPSTCPTD